MILTINNLTNKKELILLLRNHSYFSYTLGIPNPTLIQVLNVLKTLPISFNINKSEQQYWSSLLSGLVEFSISKSEYEIDIELEQDKFKEAQVWYQNLCQQDKDKVNLLIRGSHPRA
jgi:hypothetical protein